VSCGIVVYLAVLTVLSFVRCDIDGVVCLAVMTMERRRARKRERNKLYWLRLQQDPQRYQRIRQRQKHYKQTRKQRHLSDCDEVAEMPATGQNRTT